jgi:hypothetical protein
LIAECRRTLALLDPEDRYDDDGDLNREDIAKRLSIMAAAIPGKGPFDANAYAIAMIEHVGSVEGLTYIALDDACRRRAEGKPFHPNAGELVTLMREQQEIWERRTGAINGIERLARHLAEEITAFKPELDAALAARAATEAERALNAAFYRRSNAIKVAIEKQQAAALAAQEVEAALNSIAACDILVAEKAQALAEATASADPRRARPPEFQSVVN